MKIKFIEKLVETYPLFEISGIAVDYLIEMYYCKNKNAIHFLMELYLKYGTLVDELCSTLYVFYHVERISGDLRHFYINHSDMYSVCRSFYADYGQAIQLHWYDDVKLGFSNIISFQKRCGLWTVLSNDGQPSEYVYELPQMIMYRAALGIFGIKDFNVNAIEGIYNNIRTRTICLGETFYAAACRSKINFYYSCIDLMPIMYGTCDVISDKFIKNIRKMMLKSHVNFYVHPALFQRSINFIRQLKQSIDSLCSKAYSTTSDNTVNSVTVWISVCDPNISEILCSLLRNDGLLSNEKMKIGISVPGMFFNLLENCGHVTWDASLALEMYCKNNTNVRDQVAIFSTHEEDDTLKNTGRLFSCAEIYDILFDNLACKQGIVLHIETLNEVSLCKNSIVFDAYINVHDFVIKNSLSEFNYFDWYAFEKKLQVLVQYLLNIAKNSNIIYLSFEQQLEFFKKFQIYPINLANAILELNLSPNSYDAHAFVFLILNSVYYHGNIISFTSKISDIHHKQYLLYPSFNKELESNESTSRVFFEFDFYSNTRREFLIFLGNDIAAYQRKIWSKLRYTLMFYKMKPQSFVGWNRNTLVNFDLLLTQLQCLYPNECDWCFVGGKWSRLKTIQDRCNMLKNLISKLPSCNQTTIMNEALTSIDDYSYIVNMFIDKN